MQFQELKPKTWIQKDNKPYFVRDIYENVVYLALFGLSHNSSCRCWYTQDNFPTDFEPLIVSTFKIGDQALYQRLEITQKHFERQIVTIKQVDEQDALSTYVIVDNEQNMTWAMPIELEPINY
jgi:hypothetical protein